MSPHYIYTHTHSGWTVSLKKSRENLRDAGGPGCDMNYEVLDSMLGCKASCPVHSRDNCTLYPLFCFSLGSLQALQTTPQLLAASQMIRRLCGAEWRTSWTLLCPGRWKH